MNQELRPFQMSMRLKIALIVLMALGLLSLRLIYIESHQKAWTQILIGSVIFLGMGLFGLFFTGIQFLTSARWSVVVRRVMESMALTLPMAAGLFVIIYLGLHSIYEWSHPSAVDADHLLQWKSPFLNSKFFGIRLIVYFSIWILSSWVLIKNSNLQDQTGNAQITEKNRKISAFIMVLFGLSCSMAGFDILMSLEPHWFSTIFGVYFFAGLFQAGLAMLLILSWLAYRSGATQGFVTVDHFHDIARFLFGFSVFWAYIAFSQFMLIWYGNLPEETFFYIERLKHGWEWVSLALVLIRFLAPFLILMPYGAKRCFKITIPVSVLVIAGQWLDLYWIAQPALRLQLEEAVKACITWKEISIGLGFVAFFVLIVGYIMERTRLIPMKDPRLEESVHYYHHG